MQDHCNGKAVTFQGLGEELEFRRKDDRPQQTRGGAATNNEPRMSKSEKNKEPQMQRSETCRLRAAPLPYCNSMQSVLYYQNNLKHRLATCRMDEFSST